MKVSSLWNIYKLSSDLRNWMIQKLVTFPSEKLTSKKQWQQICRSTKVVMRSKSLFWKKWTMRKCPISPSQGSSFSPLFLLHPQGFVKLSRERWKYLWWFFYITWRGFCSQLYSFCIKIKNKENGGGRGRTEGQEQGKKKKNSYLLMFQNRFWKLPEERVHRKKRFGTAEANTSAIHWEECLRWQEVPN